MMTEEKILKVADFNPKVCTYWLISGAMIFVFSIIGIPLLLLWFPIGSVFTKRYLKRMSCELTNSSLHVKKGIFVRSEKTIPLEKITDMGMIQGPIMRRMGLFQLSVETAGQSSGVGSLISLTGIENAPAFRQAVLDQRDLKQKGKTSTETALKTADSVESLLTEIRDSLQRLETQFRQQDK